MADGGVEVVVVVSGGWRREKESGMVQGQAGVERPPPISDASCHASCRAEDACARDRCNGI
jgi:hypothetical protein